MQYWYFKNFVAPKLPEMAVTIYQRNTNYYYGATQMGSAANVPLNIAEIGVYDTRGFEPIVLYHNHPYDIGAFISNADTNVYNKVYGWLQQPFWAVITDFVTIKFWWYANYQPNLLLKLNFKNFLSLKSELKVDLNKILEVTHERQPR